MKENILKKLANQPLKPREFGRNVFMGGKYLSGL